MSLQKISESHPIFIIEQIELYLLKLFHYSGLKHQGRLKAERIAGSLANLTLMSLFSNLIASHAKRNSILFRTFTPSILLSLEPVSAKRVK
jgi:hypothetical protein